MISKAAIRFVKSLQDKKQRQKYNQFIVEGEKSITELLKSQFRIVKLYAVQAWLEANILNIDKIDVDVVDSAELKQMSSHQSPQNALAVVEFKHPESISSEDKFVIGLDEIQDPGNLGTIIRIADWYGIKHIVCSKGSTDLYNPKCINSTMGSFLRVNVHYGDIVEYSKSAKLPLMVAVLYGVNIHQGALPKKGLLVIGNEGHGVKNDIIQQAAHLLTIPRFGEAESLNAAVSTAILLDNLVR
ncbi:MAG: RNA methyltransferase [Bacteroidia bacterium]|nr:RNA methyltransferase [Bacteroidia bacterium]